MVNLHQLTPPSFTQSYRDHRFYNVISPYMYKRDESKRRQQLKSADIELMRELEPDRQRVDRFVPLFCSRCVNLYQHRCDFQLSASQYTAWRKK